MKTQWVTQCDVIIEKRRRVFEVCGRRHDGKQHYNGMTPHKSEPHLGIHYTHDMELDPIDGLICGNCNAHSHGDEKKLKAECTG